MTYQMGQKLGNYRLVRLLGSGGFAEVYLAKHIYLHTQAAIKVLQVQLTEDALQSFLQEARIIANLEHANIVRVLEFGIENHRPYLVMNYAAHGTLRQRYPRGKQLSPATVLTLLKQIVAALDYAHTRKIIHRDVKPENMLFGANNTVLLSDFGLALEGHSASSSPPADKAGTMLYMAPEQFRGHPCAASDQYSLGIVVYEWLSGTLPFTGDGLAIAVQHAQTMPTALYERVPALPIALSNVVMRALHKEPQTRFAQIQEFAIAFEEACHSHAALFTSSASTQLLAESVVEAQSVHIAADTLARISLEDMIPAASQAHSSDSELNFLQKDVLLDTLENQTLSSNKNAQVSLEAEEMTLPVSPELYVQENDTPETLFVRPFALPQQRRRILLGGLASVMLLLGCLSIFWEVQAQYSLTPHNQMDLIAHTPYALSTTIQTKAGRPTRKSTPVRQATNSIGIGPTEPLQANQVAIAPTPGLTTIVAYNTPLMTMPPVTQTSTPTPTPPPITTPTPTAPSSQPDGALSVSISNVPNVVQNDSTIPVQIITNQGNCAVRLRVIYSTATQIYRSDLNRTDSNGNATVNWNVNIPHSHSQIKYTVATLLVTAYNSHGETVVSLPTVVQVI